jgi:hypothetical protein
MTKVDRCDQSGVHSASPTPLGHLMLSEVFHVQKSADLVGRFAMKAGKTLVFSAFFVCGILAVKDL